MGRLICSVLILLTAACATQKPAVGPRAPAQVTLMEPSDDVAACVYFAATLRVPVDKALDRCARHARPLITNAGLAYLPNGQPVDYGFTLLKWYKCVNDHNAKGLSLGEARLACQDLRPKADLDRGL